MIKCFFFQAEDGIRDIGVTGVQTCALPISRLVENVRNALDAAGHARVKIVVSGGFTADRIREFEAAGIPVDAYGVGSSRSEERRVGKEGRSRWAPYHLKKKTLLIHA